MPYPEKLLGDDEDVVQHLHPHWLTIFWPVVWFLLIVGGLWLRKVTTLKF